MAHALTGDFWEVLNTKGERQGVHKSSAGRKFWKKYSDCPVVAELVEMTGSPSWLLPHGGGWEVGAGVLPSQGQVSTGKEQWDSSHGGPDCPRPTLLCNRVSGCQCCWAASGLSRGVCITHTHRGTLTLADQQAQAPKYWCLIKQLPLVDGPGILQTFALVLAISPHSLFPVVSPTLGRGPTCPLPYSSSLWLLRPLCFPKLVSSFVHLLPRWSSPEVLSPVPEWPS